jgi:pyruvate,water dikinase
MSYVAWASDTGEDALERIGGKGANLAEMMSVGLPVPTAFFVTSGAYAAFIEEAGIGEKIDGLLSDVDVDDNDALADAADRVQQLILDREVPERIRSDIVDAYDRLEEDGDADVAIRSSATAEDLPEASFAGQQETFLHVDGPDEVVRRVQECWASLFTPRAIYYRVKNDFPHEKVRMGVVVQRMVDADRAGVLFTRHPTTGDDRIIVEAAWGLGEGVVSGRVSPDNYVLSREGTVQDATIATKDTEIVRADDGQGTLERTTDGRADDRVLDETHLDRLAGLARTLEDHYGEPQDVEWAWEEGELFVLQTRPVTTIKEPETMNDTTSPTQDTELLIEGLGASPGTGAGPVARLDSSDELDRCEEGDVLVTSMTTPDMVPAMRRATAIVTDEGGMTCHAAIVGRELGVPCVVGAKDATSVLSEGQQVTVDGDRGSVEAGIQQTSETDETPTETTPTQAAGPARVPTATEVKVNISMPEATDRARATDADGVGLLRVEHIVLGLGRHPMTVIDEEGTDAFADHLAEDIRGVADAFQPRPVWVRTLDAPTDEFRQLPGGDDEPDEANPMLGWRGIRRDLGQPELLRAQFEAIRRLRADGYENIGVMLPLVQHPSELREAKQIARDVGLDPEADVSFGIMIETPASALIIDEFVEEGLDFVSFGTNDLTQYTLAVDRNNGNVANLFDEFHPGVGRLIEHVIDVCNDHDIATSICGQAGSDPDFAEKLVEWGISSISANIDAVDRVRETVARSEQRLILEDVRDRR